jgi:hypothetical protein
MLPCNLFSFACQKRQRDDTFVNIHNFSVPEKLPFKMESQTGLTDGIFDSSVPDSSKMQRFDKNATIQLIRILDNIFKANLHRDSVPPIFYENERFFIYGNLDLQPNVNSITVWEFDKDIYYKTDHSRHLWLFNLKNGKLCSVACLDFLPGIYIDPPPFSTATYLKNKCFTSVHRKNDIYEPFSVKLERLIRGKWEIVDTWYTHYTVNKDGFIEFVED